LGGTVEYDIWEGFLLLKRDGGSANSGILNSAVRAATREISKTAMIWALTYDVHPSRSIILLVIIPAQRSGSKFWGFPLFARNCASGHKSVLDEKCDLSELCSQLRRKLDEYDIDKINVR
jgi:hypothetical protein